MDLYYHIIPPPSRAVLVLADLLNLEFNLTSIDTRDEQELAVLTKVNPLQSLPTLIDGDIVVGEPHAVLLHLTIRFDSGGTLYPAELRVRSSIHQCLFFDTNLYKCMNDRFTKSISPRPSLWSVTSPESRDLQNHKPMDLYYHPISPPCWSVLLLGRELNLTFNLKVIDNSVQGAARESFVKFNPQHQVPTLVDGDFAIGESRAILSYLMDAHAGSDDHPLYPRAPKSRALIQHRLNFDLGMLYRRAYDYFSPIWRSGTIGTDADREKLREALGFLEEYLGRSEYAAGDRLTIADLALVASVSFMDVCRFEELASYPKVSTWYERCREELKGYQEAVADQFSDARAFIEQFK